MRDTINDDRNKTKAFPTTIQLYANRLLTRQECIYLLSGKESGEGRRNTYAMVYASLITEQLQRPCSNCKQLGHWARECHEEDHRKEEQKQDNGNGKGNRLTLNQIYMDCPSKKKGAADGAGRKKKAFNVRADDAPSNLMTFSVSLWE